MYTCLIACLLFAISISVAYAANSDEHAVTLNITDNILPTIYLVAPVNTTNTTNATNIHTFYVIDPDDLTFDCDVYYNSTSRGSNSTVANNTTTNISVTVATSGIYTWWINCTDSEGTNTSAQWIINISLPSAPVPDGPGGDRGGGGAGQITKKPVDIDIKPKLLNYQQSKVSVISEYETLELWYWMEDGNYSTIGEKHYIKVHNLSEDKLWSNNFLFTKEIITPENYKPGAYFHVVEAVDPFYGNTVYGPDGQRVELPTKAYYKVINGLFAFNANSNIKLCKTNPLKCLLNFIFSPIVFIILIATLLILSFNIKFDDSKQYSL